MKTQEFLRQLTTEIPAAEGKKLFALLCMQGIEVFGKEKNSEEYRNLTEAADAENGIFYVSAADREAAVQIMEEASLSEYVSESNRVMSEAESYLEHAESEYYRKRKVTMYETLAVILAVMLFYLIRSWT